MRGFWEDGDALWTLGLFGCDGNVLGCKGGFGVAARTFLGAVKSFWECREFVGWRRHLEVVGWIGGDEDFLGCSVECLEAQG